MRTGALHHRVLTTVAAVAALTLALPALPAQAGPAPPGHALTPRTDTRYVMWCLFNDNDACQGPHFDASGTALQVFEVFGDSGLVVSGIEWLAAQSAWVAKVVEFLGRGAPEYDPLKEECVGDWKKRSPLTFGSCKSHHGIYWQFHYTNSKHTSWELYNTYTQEYMVAPGGNPTQHEWIDDGPLHSGEWYTWGDYTPSAGP